MVDIIALAVLPDFDFGLFKKFTKKYGKSSQLKILRAVFTKTQEVKELGLNHHRFAKVKQNLQEKF